MSGPARCRRRRRRSGFVEIFRTTPPRTVCPNFFVLAHANGCAFAPGCSYCYLKSSLWFLGRPEVFTNEKAMVAEVKRWIARDNLESYVLNTGNLSDSLSFEAVRPLMARLVQVFRESARGRPHTLLLVTKGGTRECRPLLAAAPCENVVVSFSVNSPEAAARLEKGAAPVPDRLRAARRLRDRGWRVRMRLDPMILGYDYAGVIAALRDFAPERLTLGSLRAEPSLLRAVGNGLFRDLERAADPKGLSRYPFADRLRLYRQAVDAMRGVCPVALCEEEPRMWDALGLDRSAKPCNCGL